MLDGILFFPVTAFDANGQVNSDVLAEHVSLGVAAGAGAVFAACGTGEFHALSSTEHQTVVQTAVNQVAGKVPVFAGVGGPIAGAATMAEAAKRSGADGLLVLPPYLVSAPQDGIYAYVEAISRAATLPLIVYHRDNSVLTPETAARIATIPGVVGIKDGHGNLGLLRKIISAVRPVVAGSGKPFQFFNGLPTAETTMLEYREAGVSLYSSAVFSFAPELATTFYQALSTHNFAQVDTLLQKFFVPFVSLRSKVPGYAVALVKAGVRARGLAVGGVRPPLIDPSPADLAELKMILREGLDACAAYAGGLQ